MRVLGIDPGASGAIAILEGGQLVAVHDMPVIEVKKRRRVIAAELARIVRDAKAGHAFLELVASMPRDGHAGAFAFGRSFGLIEGVIAAVGVPVTTVAPVVWKRRMNVTADKSSSRLRASQLFPPLSSLFARVKDDGRAEAALIGLYGHRLDDRSIEW